MRLAVLFLLLSVVPASSRPPDAIAGFTLPFVLTEQGVRIEPRLTQKPEEPRETRTQPSFTPYSDGRRRR